MKYNILVFLMVGFIFFITPSYYSEAKVFAKNFFIPACPSQGEYDGSCDGFFADIKSGIGALANPGDTLFIREGTYPVSGSKIDIRGSGSQQNPIKIKNFVDERVILKGVAVEQETNKTKSGIMIVNRPELKISNKENIEIDGIIFESMGKIGINNGSRNIIIKNAEFKSSHDTAITVRDAYDIKIDNCFMHEIRSRISGKDTVDGTGLDVLGIYISLVDGLEITNSVFRNIGGDGVHLEPSGTIKNVIIQNNQFFVRRKDFPNDSINWAVPVDETDQPLEQEYINGQYNTLYENIGENGIDIKNVVGPVVVSGNIVYGFRTANGARIDVSGANGSGIVVHGTQRGEARNVAIKDNLLYDNTINLSIAQGLEPGGVRNVKVFNNILKEAKVDNIRHSNGYGGWGLLMANASSTEVYNNTFYDNHQPFYLKNLFSDIIFRNNIFYKGQAGVNNVHLDTDYNLWSQISVPDSMHASHDLLVDDPLLNDSLVPAQSSAAIGAGENLYSQGVTADFAGTARPQSGNFTIGAYEYNANTASVTPSTGSQCHNIEVLINGAASSPSDEIKIGDQLQFVCSADVESQQKVMFALYIPGSCNPDTTVLNNGATANTSAAYIVVNGGSFAVQCTVCDQNGQNCNWENYSPVGC